MEEYDVVVAGGGIAGSVAARFAAKNGLKTLLLERYKTPRNKPCSGIQFRYLERLIGKTIPREMLCKNELYKIEIITPKDKIIKANMGMLNFWRSTFDSWLNSLAMDAGAEFRDETSLTDFIKNEDGVIVKISTGNTHEEVKAHYLIGADGMLSTVRKKLRPQDFDRKPSGATVNYYFVGETDLDPNTLYMFYKKEFCPMMFAWVYLKDDTWVIGTGAYQNPLEYVDKFFNFVKGKYALRGKIIRREGFSSTLKSTVYLGEGRVMMIGDTAGLVDTYRGLGMDNAALSGRLAIKAITWAEDSHSEVVEIYRNLIKRIVLKTENNMKRQMERYASDSVLEKSLSPFNMLKGGLLMLLANQLNRILPPDRLILLPL